MGLRLMRIAMCGLRMERLLTPLQGLRKMLDLEWKCPQKKNEIRKCFHLNYLTKQLALLLHNVTSYTALSTNEPRCY